MVSYVRTHRRTPLSSEEIAMDTESIRLFTEVIAHGGISEAARLGFGRIVVSGYLRKSLPKPPGGIRIAYVNKIEEMARAVFGA